MPFADDPFDFVVCRAAFRNFSEPTKAIREMRRVLRRSAKGVIIDLRRDASMRDITNYIDSTGVNVVNESFMKFTFRFMLLPRAYTIEQFRQMLAEVPFARTWIEETPVGLEAWFEK